MIISIKKGTTAEEISHLINKGSKSKVAPTQQGFDPKKHIGKVKWEQDPLAYQQALRGE